MAKSVENSGEKDLEHSLILSQMTNFRLFQTERFCKR